VDAEPIGVTPIDVQVVPRALRVIVPQTAPTTLFSD
jgi:diacylglycerol kinase family enzyme